MYSYVFIRQFLQRLHPAFHDRSAKPRSVCRRLCQVFPARPALTSVCLQALGGSKLWVAHGAGFWSSLFGLRPRMLCKFPNRCVGLCISAPKKAIQVHVLNMFADCQRRNLKPHDWAGCPKTIHTPRFKDVRIDRHIAIFFHTRFARRTHNQFRRGFMNRKPPEV